MMSDNGTVGQSDNLNEEASRKGAEARRLLPCPFCGGRGYFGKVRYTAATVWSQDTFYFVGCESCGADNKGLIGHIDESRAAEKWNRRVLLTVATEEAEQLPEVGK